MRLLDTSAWIELIIRGPRAARIRQEIPPPSECLVATIVQLELFKWLARERSVEDAELAIGYTWMCVIVPLDTSLALQAAELCRMHKLATADAIIYATALDRSAELVTCDAHFDKLPGVLYYPKR